MILIRRLHIKRSTKFFVLQNKLPLQNRIAWRIKSQEPIPKEYRLVHTFKMPGLIGIQDIPESKFASIANYNSQSNTEELNNFCKPVEDKYQSSGSGENLEGELREAWQSVIAAAASTPFDSPKRQRIVDFLLDLQARPAIEKNGEKCVVQAMQVWGELPLFGWVMREVWNAGKLIHTMIPLNNVLTSNTDTSDSVDTATKQQWINLNAWTSTLVASLHAKSLKEPDFSNYCIWTVRTALEEKKQPSNLELSAAAVWFIHASPAIWDFSQQGKAFDGKLAKPGPQFSEQEWRGFTKERWQSWVERLGEYEGKVSDEQTKKLAQEAKKAMAEAAKN